MNQPTINSILGHNWSYYYLTYSIKGITYKNLFVNLGDYEALRRILYLGRHIAVDNGRLSDIIQTHINDTQLRDRNGRFISAVENTVLSIRVDMSQLGEYNRDLTGANYISVTDINSQFYEYQEKDFTGTKIENLNWDRFLGVDSIKLSSAERRELLCKKYEKSVRELDGSYRYSVPRVKKHLFRKPKFSKTFYQYTGLLLDLNSIDTSCIRISNEWNSNNLYTINKHTGEMVCICSENNSNIYALCEIQDTLTNTYYKRSYMTTVKMLKSKNF